LQLQGVLQNRAVRSPLLALDDAEYDALRAGLTASGLLWPVQFSASKKDRHL
jgi:4-hydroxy-tetrahydrodipicolinate synthase